MALAIRTIPDSILTQTSQEVSFPLQAEDRELALEMLQTVQKDEGSAGLAAVQVGKLKRIIVVSDSKRKARVLFNPIIVMSSSQTESMAEGCLSIPNKLYDVIRPTTIKFQYRDQKGKTHVEKASGWEARVIQHEIDHLNGILITAKGREVDTKTLKAFGEKNP